MKLEPKNFTDRLGNRRIKYIPRFLENEERVVNETGEPREGGA